MEILDTCIGCEEYTNVYNRRGALLCATCAEYVKALKKRQPKLTNEELIERLVQFKSMQRTTGKYISKRDAHEAHHKLAIFTGVNHDEEEN
jgi:hypothetical protein